MKLQYSIARDGIVPRSPALPLRLRGTAPLRRRPLHVAAAGAPTRRRTSGAPLQELDLEKLYTDAAYAPARLIGPVEVAPATSARPRRAVVTKRDVPTGGLLFVSEPLALARGAPGEPLRPGDLAGRMLAAGPLGDAERHRLGLLYDGTPESQKRPVSFRDFDPSAAATKASRARAAAKGFGGGGGGKAAAAASPASSASSPAASGDAAGSSGAPPPHERLEAVLSYNAWGSDIGDVGAAPARGEDLGSFVGLWPEYALLNHSCAPTVSSPTVASGRLIARAAAPLPAGTEATASYLDARGGAPLAERRRALQAAYGFTCRCARCKLEEAAPEELRSHIEALHAAAARPSGGPFDGLAAAAAARDAAALRAIDAAAAPHLEKLGALLDAAGFKPGSLERSALSAGAAEFLLQAARARAALLDAEDDGDDDGSASGGSGSGGGGSDEQQQQLLLQRREAATLELLDLVEVLRVYQPGGAQLLALAADALSVAAVRHGAGSPQAQAALQLFLKMVLAKYGEVAARPVLERLVDGLTRTGPRLAALGLGGGLVLTQQQQQPEAAAA